jgi:hypothetical protein
VAKRLVSKIRQTTDIPAIEYLFNEENTPLPDLGGIEKNLEKRTRHRRAWVRMLFDYYETDRMIVCLDPAGVDLIKDFYSDRSTTRLLEVECTFSDAFLEGHAKRVGLAGEQTPDDVIERLLPTLRADISSETDAIRDAEFLNYDRITEAKSADQNREAIARFLKITDETAQQIASTDHLFYD